MSSPASTPPKGRPTPKRPASPSARAAAAALPHASPGIKRAARTRPRQALATLVVVSLSFLLALLVLYVLPNSPPGAIAILIAGLIGLALLARFLTRHPPTIEP